MRFIKKLFIPLIALFALIGCQQSEYFLQTTKSEVVTLKIGATENIDARSVLPTNPTSSISSYALSGSKTGALAEIKTFTNLTSATVDIETGTWTLKLEAKNSSGAVLLSAEKSVNITAAATVNFELIPLAIGNGDANVELTLPTGHSVASVETLVDGTAITPALTIASDKITYAKTGLAKGEYLLVFKLKDAAGKVISVISEMVTVKPNLASNKAITLTAADFNAKPAAPTGLTAAYQAGTDATGSVKFDWTRTSKNETGFVITWNDGTTTGTISVSPGVATYTWTGATRGKSYTFTIKSTNDFGNSSDTSPTGSVYVPTLSTWTVTFNTDGGNTVASQTIQPGDKVTQPTVTMEKANYTFGGWYKESGCTTVWDFANDTVLANTTIYAKWNSVAVTGLSLNVASVTIKIGNTYALSPIFTPTNTTNKSVTWSGGNANASVTDGVVTALGAGTATITATSVEDNSKTASCTVTVEALVVNEYLINYVLDGGINNGNNPATYLSTGARIVFYEPTKENKVFDGWYAENTFTNSITDIPAGSTGNKTVYAKWRNPIELDQENQPGGEVKVPSVPDARAYWLAPFVNDGNWDVGDIGAFVEGATMTTADETGLTSIAAPVTPGTYYLYYVVRDTKEILSISANYLTVLGDNVPAYYKGKFYRGYMEDADGGGAGTDYKTTVVTTDFITNWSTVGTSMFSDAVQYDNRNFVPQIMVNKMNGDIWAVTVKTGTYFVDGWQVEMQFWKYNGTIWSNELNYFDKTRGYTDVAHTKPSASAMTSDGTAMFVSMASRRHPSGSWYSDFQKRTGANFNTVSAQINDFEPNNLQIGGNYLYTLSQKNEFDAANETEHTNMLSTHTGLTVQRYDMTTNFEIANFVKIGGDYFNVAGATKYYAFNPDMYIGSDGTPYVVFVEPTTYEHCNHNSAIYPDNNWNDRFTTPKLTVMKYNGTNWVVVGAKLFSSEVYKTQEASAKTGTEFGGETEFNTKDSVYQPSICVGGGKVWVTATDTSDEAFICAFDGTNWSTIKTNYATGVRYPDMVYDNGKLYITYTKSDGSGVGYYTYIP